MRRLADRFLFGIVWGMLAVGLVAVHAAPVERAEAAAIVGAGEKDVLIFKDGSTLEGEILEETETTVRIRVTIAGLSAEQTYQKSKIVGIDRADAEGGPAEVPAAATEAPEREATPSEGAPRVYVMELTGRFGFDISGTPLRKAMDDARRNRADYVVVVLENEWSQALRGGLAEQRLFNDEASFDELFRTEKLDPIFGEELEREWEDPPTIVFWVKQAMGGAAFLPLNCQNIYFHSDGRLGGVGNLTTMFGNTGDEVVRDKQESLRLKHAEGMAIRGGYDPRLVKAMAIPEYVLSYKMEGGAPKLLERMPESADEILLTDDAADENADTDQEIVRDQGNDVLTFNAELARDLGLSKGTVDTLDDLLFELGIARDHLIVSERADRIMASWSDNLRQAFRRVRELLEHLDEIEVRGEYRERQRARGEQIATIDKIIKLLVRYGEVSPGQTSQLRGQLETRKAQIRLEMLADRR